MKQLLTNTTFKDAGDSARLAPRERPFHDFVAPLKEYPFCPILVFSVATSNLYQFFLRLDKVENFELEVV